MTTPTPSANATIVSFRPSLWRTSWAIFRTAISERLTYRSDFIFSTTIRFLPLLTQVFLWGAIFGIGTSNEQGPINGYTYSDMVVYYLLVMLTRAFSSMPGLASGIGRDVREGTISRFLIQPVDLLSYLFWTRVAHKLVYYVVATIPFAFMFWYFRAEFDGWPSATTLGAFVASLFMAFAMGFLIEALLGLIAFWFLEVSSLLFIYMLLNYFLSGHMIPLDFLPEWLATAVEILPFKYLAFTPAAIFLGRYEEAELVRVLLIEATWVVGLFLAVRWTYQRGVRRYGAFGG